MEIYKRFLQVVIWLFALIGVFVLFANVLIVGSTRNQVITEQNSTFETRTALLLGTSYNTANGEKNPFFHDRIIVAANLFKAGLVNKMILSGSKTEYYNEPHAMRHSLVELGVPDSILINDDGGVRTLDSIVRCKEVFDQDRIVIITQRFHAYRALFISNYYNLDAVVVITQPAALSIFKSVIIREFFARPLAVLDLYVMHSKPKFETVIIN